MKYIRFIFILFFHYNFADTLEFTVANSNQTQKISLLLACVTDQKMPCEQMVSLIQKALEFSKQCTVRIEYFTQLPSVQETKEYKNKGFDYIVFLTVYPNQIDWHIFDLFEQKIKKSKRITKRENLRGWSYAVADSLHQALTGQAGFFQSKLAYVKQIPQKHGTYFNYIYIADYDGSNAQALITTPTVNIAPRWNKDPGRPLLFYSENTNVNMPLYAIDLQKKRILASNFEGLNMLPAFSPDGSGIVYCATRGAGNCQLYHWKAKKMQKLTNNLGNNFAPTFASENLLYFCSDFETKNPQIYLMNICDKHIDRITPDGFCVSPAYNSGAKKLAYTKMINGIMQIFIYNPQDKLHEQVTFDKNQKEECSWIGCDNYLLCSVSNEKTSRIALLNLATKEYHYLTASNEHCSYPTFSGIYNEYPEIVN